MIIFKLRTLLILSKVITRGPLLFSHGVFAVAGQSVEVPTKYHAFYKESLPMLLHLNFPATFKIGIILM